MQKIDIAETNLLQLINIGQEVCLTDHNKEVAVIIPIESYYEHKQQEAFRKLNQLKKRVNLGTVEQIINMRDEGRE